VRKEVVQKDSRRRWPKGRAVNSTEFLKLLLSTAQGARPDIAVRKSERQAKGAGCSTPILDRAYPVRKTFTQVIENSRNERTKPREAGETSG